MLPEYFAFVAVLITSLGGLQYLYLTIKGSVQPNKVSFFFWGALPLIGFFAQHQEGAGSIAWVTFAIGILPFAVIIAASFNPKSYWKIKTYDYILAVITTLTIVFWYATKDSGTALILAIFADFLASLPTMIKSYSSPFSEDWRPYAINTFGFFVGILAIQNWVFEDYSFVLYLFCATLFITLTIIARQKLNVVPVI